MDLEATEAELVDGLLSRLDDLVRICNISSADTTAEGNTTTADTPDAASDAGDATPQTRLAKLFRDRDEAIERLKKHNAERKTRPDVPAPKFALACSSELEALEQGPQLTSTDYDVLLKGQQRKIEIDFDRAARSAGLLQSSKFQPVPLPSRHAEEILEMYFDNYGSPRDGDQFTLWRMLRVDKSLLIRFFAEKSKLYQPVREAQAMLHTKEFLMGLQMKGELGSFMQKKRIEYAAAQVQVGSMD